MFKAELTKSKAEIGKAESRNRKSDIRGRRSEGRKSEFSGQRSVVGSQRLTHRLHLLFSHRWIQWERDNSLTEIPGVREVGRTGSLAKGSEGGDEWIMQTRLDARGFQRFGAAPPGFRIRRNDSHQMARSG